MVTPSPLPAHLSANPPIPDDELSLLFGALASDPDLTPEAVIGGAESTVGPPLPARAAGFALEDVGAAEWAMRRLREAHEALEQVKAQRDQWVAEVDEWAQREADRHLVAEGWFRHLLEGYGRRLREEDPRTATYRLPSGNIETTVRKPAAKVTDPELVVKWAKDNAPAAVEETTTYKVPAAAAKELGVLVTHDDGTVTFRTPDGEEVPGMTVEPGRVEVRIKPVVG